MFYVIYKEIHLFVSLFDAIVLSLWWMYLCALMFVGKLSSSELSQKILLCQIRIQFGHRTPETQNEHFLSHKRFSHQFYIIPERGSNNTIQFNIFKVEGSLDFIKM
jgi:hypothetical protein